MSTRTRLLLFVLPALGVAALLVWSFTGLPSFGHYPGPYGNVVNAQVVPVRHATNAVASVNFDFRGVDTIGEEFILFAAVMGTSALLRVQRRERQEGSSDDRDESHPAAETAGAVQVICMALVAPIVLLGIYIVVHGHLTPGGGFQGGVILATAPLMVYLGGRYIVFRQVSPKGLLDFGEGAGAGGFVAIGFIAMLAGAAFLENVFPLGKASEVFSAGTIPVINLSVGLEVAGGLLLVMWEFLEQALVVRG